MGNKCNVGRPEGIVSAQSDQSSWSVYQIDFEPNFTDDSEANIYAKVTIP